MIDPWLSYYGHPILPAGFNSTDVDGDMFDGPGVNEPVWPDLIDSFRFIPIVIITEQMMEAFDGCADVIIRHQANSITLPPETRVLTIRGRKAA